MCQLPEFAWDYFQNHSTINDLPNLVMFLVNKAAPCMWEHGFILDLGIDLYASFMFPWTYHNCFDHIILCILLTHTKATMTTIELCYIIFMHHMANWIWL